MHATHRAAVGAFTFGLRVPRVALVRSNSNGEVSRDVNADESKTPPGAPVKRIQRSALLPEDLVNRARAAVYWCRMVPGEPGSYAALNERALEAEVSRLEQAYNHGEPFELPEGEGLRPGPAQGVMEKVAQLRKAAKEAPGEPTGRASNGD